MKKSDLYLEGYHAWLGCPALDAETARHCLPYFKNIFVNDPSNLQLSTAKQELRNAVKSLLGKTMRLVPNPMLKGTVILCIIKKDSRESDANQKQASAGQLLCGKISDEERDMLGEEGYLIKFINSGTGRNLIIAGKSGAGILYGVYGLIRALQCGSFNDSIYMLENPAIPIRMLNHWDNMDGSVERGYSGRSIFFDNGRIVSGLSRLRDYARLTASIGLNGVVINNVNVHNNETKLITKEFLPKVAKIADLFRRYGIKIYLSINFASPIELGGLETADPLDKNVQEWWRAKAAEIYSYIPDFGGFLVKADSEFRPGPFTYGRNHAEGANMLASALKLYGGLLIWRCFVYNCMQDWRDRKTDRANAAYDIFMPLDGCFDDNVLLQIKNGPMDFQVREPVSPLFGGLRKTNIMLELQITQEYTGQQKHLCYLGQMWKDVLDFDTWRDGKGSTVKKILSGAKNDGKITGIAAVSNVGNDLNWTGHDLAQANFYCFGRLAWDPGLSVSDIASEWIRQTFGSDSLVMETIRTMLLDSYHIYESYTSPLGIGWMVNPGHHYGPNVDGYEYSAWGTYHRADCHGIGIDRSVSGGTGYAGRYNPEVAKLYEKPETCPEELLLFFHRIPYNYRLKSGTTLIQYIYDSHFDGAEKAAMLAEKWKSLKDRIPGRCYERVLKRLKDQASHACEWRDVINAYFYRKSGIPDEKSRTIY
ncbi:MAG: alpha-glucuronidase family glycosyl hydrolase [Bacillota bacterium]